MYSAFYGLSESPFELTYNPRFVFYAACHREARDLLEDGLLSGAPLTVVLGAAGTGKTTLLQTSLQSERCRHVQCYYLTSSTATRERLVDTLLAELEPNLASWPAVTPTLTPVEQLRGILQTRRSQNLLTALAVDEAEGLDDERLAELGELMALRTGDAPLLPLVLAGQPALGARLDASGLAPLVEHGKRRCHLTALDLAQTAAYILWRARAAGADGGALFTREAVTVVHEYAAGVPRTINVICDNALLIGFLHRQKPVTRETVSEVCSQLDLTAPASEFREEADVQVGLETL